MKKDKIIKIVLILFTILFLFGIKKFLVNDKMDNGQFVKNQKISSNVQLDKNKAYYSKEDVALFIHTFKKLPKNYLTKDEAKRKGWNASEGNLWDVTDKGVIGGDVFHNREGKLPKNTKYFEADVNYKGGRRGSERLVFTKEGKVIYYTKDHYKNFEVIYE